MADYSGIDYGMGRTNIDKTNGIRYGIASANALAHWIWDEFEADYGDPHCPRCGATVNEKPGRYDAEEYERLAGCSPDYCCDGCKITFDGSKAYGDEAIGYILDNGEYKASIDSDGDLWVFKSPYYTRGMFCSPCAPGAVTITSPVDGGPQAYCMGADWFDDASPCPYPIWRIGLDDWIEVDGAHIPVDRLIYWPSDYYDNILFWGEDDPTDRSFDHNDIDWGVWDAIDATVEYWDSTETVEWC